MLVMGRERCRNLKTSHIKNRAKMDILKFLDYLPDMQPRVAGARSEGLVSFWNYLERAKDIVESCILRRMNWESLVVCRNPPLSKVRLMKKWLGGGSGWLFREREQFR